MTQSICPSQSDPVNLTQLIWPSQSDQVNLTKFSLFFSEISERCRDVITSLHIRIYFANVGAQANPQAKIIGVHYNFDNEDIVYQCVGLNCRINGTRPIEISTSVSFVDMTQPALPQFKEKPVLEAKLPHDFFYPFMKSYSVSVSVMPKISISLLFFMLFYSVLWTNIQFFRCV